MKGGGNAVEATRKQPLGRASKLSIGLWAVEVKKVLPDALRFEAIQEAA